MTRALLATTAGFFGAALLIGHISSSIIGSVLGPFAPTPFLAVALGLGLNQLPFGLVGGVAAIGVLTGSLAMVAVYVALDGLPASVVSWLALSRRKLADGTSDWMPVGQIVAITAAGFGALTLVVLLGFDQGEQTLESAVRGYLGLALAQMQLLEGMPDAEIILDALAQVFPGLVAWSITGRLLVSAALAQWLVKRLGSEIRPTPLYRAISIPGWAVGLFTAVLVIAWAAPGDMGYAATNVALVLALPLLLQGLAVVHTGVRQTSNALIWLGVFYGVFVFAFVLVAMAVIALGALEHHLKLRERMTADG